MVKRTGAMTNEPINLTCLSSFAVLFILHDACPTPYIPAWCTTGLPGRTLIMVKKDGFLQRVNERLKGAK
jgi:hypothetical protein